MENEQRAIEIISYAIALNLTYFVSSINLIYIRRLAELQTQNILPAPMKEGTNND